MSVLESRIERVCVAIAERHGCWLIKLDSRTHWPDRVCFIPGGRHFFAEFKKPGGELSPGQRHVQSQLIAAGHEYFEIDNTILFKGLLLERLSVLPIKNTS